MTDLHSLIHRMADELDHYRQLLTDNRTELHPLATEARAALAEPEPEGPTDEEIIAFWSEHCAGDGDAGIIRLARWGRPTPQPTAEDSSLPQPANGEVAELVADLLECADSCTLASKPYWAAPMRRAAELLERLSPPQPIPVSERLPGPEDCDAEGRCWWWYPEVPGKTYGYWAHEEDAMERAPIEQPVAWLPAHALPLPGEVTQ